MLCNTDMTVNSLLSRKRGQWERMRLRILQRHYMSKPTNHLSRFDKTDGADEETSLVAKNTWARTEDWGKAADQPRVVYNLPGKQGEYTAVRQFSFSQYLVVFPRFET